MAGTRKVDVHLYSKRKVAKCETLESIAREAGITPERLAKFNFGTADPEAVEDCLRAYVGCTRQSPEGGLLFDDGDRPGVLHIPKPAPPVTVRPGEVVEAYLQRPQFPATVEIETLDIRGHPVPNVALVLQPEKGRAAALQLTSDERGHAKKQRVPGGRYRVLLPSGESAHYWSCDSPKGGAVGRADFVKLVPAILDTAKPYAVTSVVVRRDLSPAEERERSLLHERYGPPASDDAAGPRAVIEAPSPPLKPLRACDSLALIAGWTDENFEQIDIGKLCSDLLPDFLLDHCPALAQSGYYVCVVEPATNTVTVRDRGGQVEGGFSFQAQQPIIGPFGAYAVLETNEGYLLRDISSRTYPLVQSDETRVILTGALTVVDQDRWLRIELPHRARGEGPVVYLLPTGKQLYDLALGQGTFRLEDYGSNSESNARIHERNKAVCRQVTRVYKEHISQFTKDVKKANSEQELRRLGEPKYFYQLAMPAGATKSQRSDLLGLMYDRVLKAFKALTEKRAQLGGYKSPGGLFLRLKVKYEVDAKLAEKLAGMHRPAVAELAEKVPVSVEVEGNLDVQLDHGIQIIKEDSKWRADVKLRADETVTTLTGSRVPVEISVRGPGTTSAEALGVMLTGRGNIHPDAALGIKIGPYEIRRSWGGKLKLAVDTGQGKIETEVNPHAAEMTAGFTIKLGWLARALRGQGPTAEQYAKAIANLSIGGALGFVGLTEEDVMAATPLVPAFYQSRSIGELLDPDTKWNHLNIVEQSALARLGWTQQSWDYKYDPEWRKLDRDSVPASVEKPWTALDSNEKLSIKQLWFRSYEHYGQSLKQALALRGH